MNKLSQQVLEENGAFAGVYFILDESRNEPPLRRANLMAKACALLEDNSDARATLSRLANELMDCEQAVQRLIATIRRENVDKLSINTALEYLLTRLEDSDLATKFLMTESALDLGLKSPARRDGDNSWIEAYHRFQTFEREFDLFMFQLRTRHWEFSNEQLDASERASDTGPLAAKSVA